MCLFLCVFLFSNDISIVIKLGGAAVHIAAIGGHLDMMEYLATKGKADPHQLMEVGFELRVWV